MSKVIEKLKNVGPGALVAAGFVGPGTVTTCTVSGASVGYTMLWALVFATVATIIFQEMAARVGIASQKGLGENIRGRIPNPVLRAWLSRSSLSLFSSATSPMKPATSPAAFWASRPSHLAFPWAPSSLSWACWQPS